MAEVINAKSGVYTAKFYFALSEDAKQAGRLVGDIMKTHKGQVEAGDVKRIAEEILAG